MNQIKHKFAFSQWDKNNNHLTENCINYVLINVVVLLSKTL